MQRAWTLKQRATQQARKTRQKAEDRIWEGVCPQTHCVGLSICWCPAVSRRLGQSPSHNAGGRLSPNAARRFWYLLASCRIAATGTVALPCPREGVCPQTLCVGFGICCRLAVLRRLGQSPSHHPGGRLSPNAVRRFWYLLFIIGKVHDLVIIVNRKPLRFKRKALQCRKTVNTFERTEIS